MADEEQVIIYSASLQSTTQTLKKIASMLKLIVDFY